MNQFLKLRNCRYFIRKFSGTASKNYNHSSVLNSAYFQLQDVQPLDSNVPSPPSYSFSQIRKFAKDIQGKSKKGGKVRTLHLTDEELADVIDIADYRQRLQMVVDKLKKDYVEQLSLRSAAGSVEKVIVKIDGEEYPLNELAVISKKNPNLVAINMVDFPEGLKPALQAIIESGSDLNPQQEGTMIYLTIPKLTREYRENLVKNSKSLFVKAKEEVRSIQNSFVREAKGQTSLSKDLVYNTTNQIMAIAELCVTDLEKVMKVKQKELLGES